ncbi:hypothetical protein [Roseovarius aestuariivivens]|uniref:hypothetical protein n=1 Tax=Roseovarius aestuariivivens TaxID=1888910 RepID=UPI0010804D00|nr:hypothetical protein [Roseovarius aestuariivivens]
MPMTEDVAVFQWTFKPSGEMLIAVIIAPVNGRIAVCGLWTITQRLSAEARRDQLPRHARGKSSLYLGNRKIMDGLRHIKQVSVDDFVVGTLAPCVLTKHAWHSSYANLKLEIRAPSFQAF